MTEYRKAELKDVKTLKKASFSNGFFANNYSAVNSFLYRNKYSSEIAIKDGWIYERYFKDDMYCYSFPHNTDGDNTAIKEKLLQTAEESKNVYGCFILNNITQAEKNIVLDVFPDAMVKEDRNLSDYIYLTENLSLLPGKKLSRKRNHLHQFNKIYSECHYEELCKENINIIKQLEQHWITEKESEKEDKNSLTELYCEQKMIEEALTSIDELNKDANLSGGIAFSKDVPFAFCIYSRLSKEITDVHFEKCLSAYAEDGGYAFINNEAAKKIKTKYINREEDLGIEGLRKAKLSYFPEIILPKYNVFVKL